MSLKGVAEGKTNEQKRASNMDGNVTIKDDLTKLIKALC